MHASHEKKLAVMYMLPSKSDLQDFLQNETSPSNVSRLLVSGTAALSCSRSTIVGRAGGIHVHTQAMRYSFVCDCGRSH